VMLGVHDSTTSPPRPTRRRVRSVPSVFRSM
jgi:hypothetical protein